MTNPTEAESTGRLKLPVWMIGLLLVIGVAGAALAPDGLDTFLGLLFVINLVIAVWAFSAELKGLHKAYKAGTLQFTTGDNLKKKLRSRAMKSQSVPMWQLLLLGLGLAGLVLALVILVIKIVGALIGAIVGFGIVLFVIVVMSLLGFLAYKQARKRGLIG